MIILVDFIMQNPRSSIKP